MCECSRARKHTRQSEHFTFRAITLIGYTVWRHIHKCQCVVIGIRVGCLCLAWLFNAAVAISFWACAQRRSNMLETPSINESTPVTRCIRDSDCRRTIKVRLMRFYAILWHLLHCRWMDFCATNASSSLSKSFSQDKKCVHVHNIVRYTNSFRAHFVGRFDERVSSCWQNWTVPSFAGKRYCCCIAANFMAIVDAVRRFWGGHIKLFFSHHKATSTLVVFSRVTFTLECGICFLFLFSVDLN